VALGFVITSALSNTVVYTGWLFASLPLSVTVPETVTVVYPGVVPVETVAWGVVLLVPLVVSLLAVAVTGRR
jgi:hypothetical protein